MAEAAIAMHGSLPPLCERDMSAERINEIVNSPDLRPFIGDTEVGPLDFSALVANPLNFNLMGEHGGCLFLWSAVGAYEVHTHVLKSGRGAWAFAFAKVASAWMFTRTDCFEITTRIPQPHDAARMLAVKTGMRHEFSRSGPCKFEGQDCGVDIYSVRIQDWAPKNGQFDERSIKFCEKAGIPHGDQNLNRYLGIALEMFVRDQPLKGIQWFNRWAFASRFPKAILVGVKPTIVKFGQSAAVFRGDDFEVIS